MERYAPWGARHSCQMTAAEMATPDAYLLSHSAMPSRRAAYDLSSDGLSSALRGAGYAKDGSR
jgi:hypothetical protein